MMKAGEIQRRSESSLKVANLAQHMMDRSTLSGKVHIATEASSQRSMKDEIAEVRMRLNKASRLVLDPKSRFVRRLDVCVCACVAVTALVTPVEVAFSSAQFGLGFVLDRLTDVVFLIDMVAQFFVAYSDKTKGNILVKDAKMIANRYLSTWFLLDLISCIPFDLLTRLSWIKQRRQFQLLILLRLVKLVRVARLSRLQKRWEQYAIYNIGYASLSIMKLSILVALFAHWSACFWGLQANPTFIGENTWSWILDRQERLKSHFRKGRVDHVYFASLYFAIYTMTGIGYGDVVATTHRECVSCVFIMASSAIFWAFMIGNFCSIVASMNAQESLYRHRLDELNHMMADRKFPQALRDRCRMFLINTKQHQRTARYRQLESLFSISLRGDVAAELNSAWIRKLWYLNHASKEFIVEVSQVLNSIMFAPTEPIDLSMSLFILQNGIAARKGRILATGSLWGLEFIMEEVHLIDTTCAAALSYALVVSLARDDVFAILEDPAFKPEAEMVARASRFYALKMRLLKAVQEIKKKKSAATFLSFGTSKPAIKRHSLGSSGGSGITSNKKRGSLGAASHRSSEPAIDLEGSSSPEVNVHLPHMRFTEDIVPLNTVNNSNSGRIHRSSIGTAPARENGIHLPPLQKSGGDGLAQEAIPPIKMSSAKVDDDASSTYNIFQHDNKSSPRSCAGDSVCDVAVKSSQLGRMISSNTARLEDLIMSLGHEVEGIHRELSKQSGYGLRRSSLASVDAQSDHQYVMSSRATRRRRHSSWTSEDTIFALTRQSSAQGSVDRSSADSLQEEER